MHLDARVEALVLVHVPAHEGRAGRRGVTQINVVDRPSGRVDPAPAGAAGEGAFGRGKVDHCADVDRSQEGADLGGGSWVTVEDRAVLQDVLPGEAVKHEGRDQVVWHCATGGEVGPGQLPELGVVGHLGAQLVSGGDVNGLEGGREESRLGAFA